MIWIKERFIPIFIICFLALALGAVGYIRHQGPQNCLPAQDAHNQSESGPASKLPVVGNIEETPTSKQGQKPDDWQTRDNKAQVGMFWVATVATGLTGLGLIMVGFTLFFTKQAAQSASDTLKESKFSTELGLQPYLSASQIKVIDSGEKFKVHPDNQTIFHGEIKITNNGKTPVWIRKVECSSTINAHRHNVTDIVTPDGRHNNFTYIASGASDVIHTFLGFRFKIDGFPPEAFELNDLIYNIVVNILYDDMFSLKRTEFKTFSCEYGIRFELTECTDSHGETKLRPCLKLLNSRMLVNQDDIHPSKR